MEDTLLYDSGVLDAVARIDGKNNLYVHGPIDAFKSGKIRIHHRYTGLFVTEIVVFKVVEPQRIDHERPSTLFSRLFDIPTKWTEWIDGFLLCDDLSRVESSDYVVQSPADCVDVEKLPAISWRWNGKP